MRTIMVSLQTRSHAMQVPKESDQAAVKPGNLVFYLGQ